MISFRNVIRFRSTAGILVSISALTVAVFLVSWVHNARLTAQICNPNGPNGQCPINTSCSPFTNTCVANPISCGLSGSCPEGFNCTGGVCQNAQGSEGGDGVGGKGGGGQTSNRHPSMSRYLSRSKWRMRHRMLRGCFRINDHAAVL